MTKIFQTARAWQKNLDRLKYFSTDEIHYSYDKYIARPTEIFLNRQKFLNSRSLLSGTRSNGMAIFEKCVSKILVNFWRLSYFPEIRKCWEFSVPLGLSTRSDTRHILALKKLSERSPAIKTGKNKHVIHRPRSSFNAIKKKEFWSSAFRLG